MSSAVIAALLWTYQPALSFSFLNWDDHLVILQNPQLQFPAVWQWAFTTTYMEHYQPLSWLVWAGIKSVFGSDARAFHAANIAAHLVCVWLVWAVARALFARILPHVSDRARGLTALATAILFGIHPLRVEVVAWISALPYSLALALLLLSVLAYVRASAQHSFGWRGAALALYAASLLARPVALGYPIVLFLLDVAIVGRRARASVAGLWPFALLALAAAVVESAARAAGRYEASWLFRLQSALAAPFVYLWRTVAPVTLTPLDALPLDPVIDIGVLLAAAIALAGISLAAWTWRARWPAAAAAWAAYLALLAPAAGLLPSGLQLTADRYAYLPGVVMAMAIAGAVTHWSARLTPARLQLVVVAVAGVAIASALATRAALAPWSDSVTLWTRVVSLDPRHDVGLYNLATALDAEGRPGEAAERYRELLAVQPAHSLARANLDRLDAAQFEREANELAAKGDLAGAAERYQRAIALDPQRTHAHASRGMALATLGRSAEAIAELREAVRQGADDAAVFNALGVLLLQSGETREARDVLQKGLASRPEDLNLAHNLARLLATSADDQADAASALKLASAVVDATAGRDPRALDTLAAALAINGQVTAAAATSARAAAVAEAQGDRELAAEIKGRGRRYVRAR